MTSSLFIKDTYLVKVNERIEARFYNNWFVALAKIAQSFFRMQITSMLTH